MRKPLTPPLTGFADLSVGRAVSAVAYKLHPNTGRGSTTGLPEQMANAFRGGQGVLARCGEEPLRVIFVGYTAGSDTIYFEPYAR